VLTAATASIPATEHPPRDKYLAGPGPRAHKSPVAIPARFFVLCRRLRHANARSLASAAYNWLCPAHPVLGPNILAAISSGTGLEIGGPSRVFLPRKILPIYPVAARIDNVNFASQTAWEAGLRDGGEFHFHTSRPPGRQFLREATDLQGIPDNTYDFVLSSHCLEHVANPLAALREWLRVVRHGGHLVLLLPDRAHTFDQRRPVTTLAHLREDFTRRTADDDLTHLEEILALHDLRRDAWAGGHKAFRARSLLNANNRCLHHHVFDLALMQAALLEAGWLVEGAEYVRPLHLLALAQRPGQTKTTTT
jgi:SAM-dependent methyltransferase